MLAGCLATTSYGQNTIEWRKDKVTQMIFPADIVKFRTGYIAGPSDNFDALTQSDGKVLYIQPVMPLDETNLNRSEERRVGKECRSRWSPYH